jgi:hypothetical protein
MMDWFEQLTGFREAGYEETRAKLAVDCSGLRSLINGKSYGIGQLEFVSLADLRSRVNFGSSVAPPTKVRVVIGDVRQMHYQPENERALFQVASQFNLLEMVSPEVTPEHGVTRYQYDRTQGPACAIACGAATIYRNYFAPLDGRPGQTETRQFDGLRDVGIALGHATGRAVGSLWEMKNGYALCSRAGLDAISQHFKTLGDDDIDALRGKLCIGLHRNVEVTDAPGERRPSVSQAFCSALPVAYTSVEPRRWEPFAILVLEAAYEATLFAGVLNARQRVSNAVLLTQLGGGAFGNKDEWIHTAMRRALKAVSGFGLDVKLVSYGQPSRILLDLAQEFG